MVRSTVLVAAWRSGAARFRTAALREAAALPAPLAVAALGLPPGTDPAATLARPAGDPWWWPGYRTEPGVLRRIGGFRGFGGPWLGRPRVVAGGPTGCAVTADGARWAIVADVHGVRRDPAGRRGLGPAHSDDGGSPAGALGGHGDRRVPASVGSTVLVVSRRHSYHVDAVRPAA